MELEILPRDFAEILCIYVVWWESEIVLGPGPRKLPFPGKLGGNLRSRAKLGPRY
jgi:hypothetical protein